MKSIKIALLIALFAAIQVMGLEKPATPQTDSEILQIQNTLQQLGAEHAAAQRYIGSTAFSTIQTRISELTQQLKNVLTPEQRATIKSQIEQLKLNIKKYTQTAPAA